MGRRSGRDADRQAENPDHLILVDSGVWIDFLADRQSLQTTALERFVRSRRLAIGDLMLCEVLQGCRSDRHVDFTMQRLALAELLMISDGHVAVQAASNYRQLRSLGITVRKTIDTLIATRCILDGLPLLYSDRDFDPFVEHLGLRSALDFIGVN